MAELVNCQHPRYNCTNRSDIIIASLFITENRKIKPKRSIID
jgi:hypothetical protein